MHALTSSLLNALAFGQHEWFMQLCKGKNAVPDNEILSGRVIYTVQQTETCNTTALQEELCIPSQGTEQSSPKASRNGPVTFSASSQGTMHFRSTNYWVLFRLKISEISANCQQTFSLSGRSSMCMKQSSTGDATTKSLQHRRYYDVKCSTDICVHYWCKEK